MNVISLTKYTLISIFFDLPWLNNVLRIRGGHVKRSSKNLIFIVKCYGLINPYNTHAIEHAQRPPDVTYLLSSCPKQPYNLLR